MPRVTGRSAKMSQYIVTETGLESPPVVQRRKTVLYFIAAVALHFAQRAIFAAAFGGRIAAVA